MRFRLDPVPSLRPNLRPLVPYVWLLALALAVVLLGIVLTLPPTVGPN